jgi:hypothetical protein
MCKVHLIPTINELRTTRPGVVCGECREPVKTGEYRYIMGHLDDGSGRRYEYHAHDDCFQTSEGTYGREGCFTYGGARPVEMAT